LLITKYAVENFGVFKGRHTFDLRTTNNASTKKPIIVIGGKNGSGKTTLFEGAKLCIYGRNFRGYPLPSRKYEMYLDGRIHRGAGLSKSEGSSVSIEFEHSHLGEVSRYSVRRSWTANPVKEKIEVLRNGRPVDDIAVDQLQDFLMELIPLGFSRLFFFDGEQIQQLAEDEPSNRHLTDAFNSLLGLDIITQLQTDLRIHLSRKLRENISHVEEEHRRLTEESKLLSGELELLAQEKARKQTEIDHISSEIEKIEHQLTSQGGPLADSRDQLKSRRAVLQSHILTLEDEIRELCSSLLLHYL